MLGKIISDFGSLTGVRGKKRKVPHQGVDIHDIPGTSILAARDGSVLEVHDEKCWGLTVAIDHGPDPGGEKLFALYGHLGAHTVEEGEKECFDNRKAMNDAYDQIHAEHTKSGQHTPWSNPTEIDWKKHFEEYKGKGFMSCLDQFLEDPEEEDVA